MEAEIGDREAAADHEVGHALIGTLENGWDSLRRAWIVEGHVGWGGGTDFDRLTPDAKALARVAIAGTLSEGKRSIERQGHAGDLSEHDTHAQNVRAGLDSLTRACYELHSRKTRGFRSFGTSDRRFQASSSQETPGNPVLQFITRSNDTTLERLTVA